MKVMAGKDYVLRLQRITKKRLNVLATNILQYYITIFRFFGKLNQTIIQISYGAQIKAPFDCLKKKFKKVFLVGNFKYNKNSLSTKNYIKKGNKTTCLVIPEGINQECLNLINFTMQFLKSNNSINFIWRFHPIIDIKKILKNIDYKNKQKNIEISQGNNLDFDIRKSKLVLYRGSSTVIEAVKKGLIPLYLNSNDKINIDILKQFNNPKII